VIVQIEAKLNEKNIPRNMIGREKRVVALEQYLSQARNYDPVLDGLRSAVRYDKTYFDKIVASLLPLLEKLTSGKIAQLLAPNYSDLADPRPIFDGCRSSGSAPSSMWAGCAVRRRGRRSGRQLDVQRSRVGRRAHLQARDRRWPAGRIGWRARADQRPCGRIQ
jgi:hypothetical protein